MERIATIGVRELEALPVPFMFKDIQVPEVPFTPQTLEERKETHLLIYTPAASTITINWFREQFGTDPGKELCMYNQDWYLKENFASTDTLDGRWHLIPKMVREDLRAKRPDEIESHLSGEVFPKAITLTFTFFAWHLLYGETLWKHDFLWCSDRDHNGDRIYVGRYVDPTGVNKNGFNIHRHLSLRSAYSAAPEIIS